MKPNKQARKCILYKSQRTEDRGDIQNVSSPKYNARVGDCVAPSLVELFALQINVNEHETQSLVIMGRNLQCSLLTDLLECPRNVVGKLAVLPSFHPFLKLLNRTWLFLE